MLLAPLSLQVASAVSVAAMGALAATCTSTARRVPPAGVGLWAGIVFLVAPLSVTGRPESGAWLPMLAVALLSYTHAQCSRSMATWIVLFSGVCAWWALTRSPVIAFSVLLALVCMHAADLWACKRLSGVYVYTGWLILLTMWIQSWWPGYRGTAGPAFLLNSIGILALLGWSGLLLRGGAGTRAALMFGGPVVLGVLLVLTLKQTGRAAMEYVHAFALLRIFSYASWQALARAFAYGPVSALLLLIGVLGGAWQCRRSRLGLPVYVGVLLCAALGTGQPPALLQCAHLGLATLAGLGIMHMLTLVWEVSTRRAKTGFAVRSSSTSMKHIFPRPSLHTATHSRWRTLGLCAGLILLCALVFSNTLHNQFQLDDFYSITDNPGIQRVHPIWRHFVDPRTLSTITSTVQYRPLLPLTLSLNYALHGYALPGYHIFSISVHALSAVFCFLFLLQLLRCGHGDTGGKPRVAVAWWAAALYAVHPIAGFPVNYLIARDLLLMQMFLLAALYVYLRLRLDGGAAWRWPLCLVLLGLSLCSKTNAVAAPGMIVLIEFVVLGERVTAWRAWARVAAWALTVAAFLTWVQYGVGFSDAEQLLGGDRTAYLLTQFRIHLFNYLRNYVWPFEIRALPWVPTAQSLWEWRVLLGVLVIFGSIALALALVRRRPLVSFCILAYWGMAALESSIFPLHIIATDYRTYPSLAYLCLLVVLAITHLPWRRLAVVLPGVLLAYFGVSAFYMNRHFRTGETFWRQSVRYGTHALGTMNYGMSLRGKDDAEALKYLQRAVELNPNYYLGRINLGLCYLGLGQRDEGIAEVKYGAACAPELCKDIAYFWLGQAYKAAGDVTQAYAAVRTALTHNQHNVEYLYEGAYLAQQCGDHAAASAYLSNLHTRVENHQISRFLAGWSYQARGLHEAALAEYERAIQLTPDYAQTYANKGYALHALGRYEEAARAFEEHLRRVPGHVGSLISLSNCLQRLNCNAP